MGNKGQKGGGAGKRPPRRGSTGLSSAHGSVGRREKGEKRQVSPEEEALTCSPSVAASLPLLRPAAAHGQLLAAAAEPESRS